MYEVLVIENCPEYNGPPLACWTETFQSYEQACIYRDSMIVSEPLTYTHLMVTTLITNLKVSGKAGLLEVTP
jgi:hypothetical protein